MSARQDRRYAPETAMGAAFFTALMRLVERGNRAGTIAIPTGNVDVRELAKVVTALKCAGQIQTRRAGR